MAASFLYASGGKGHFPPSPLSVCVPLFLPSLCLCLLSISHVASHACIHMGVGKHTPGGTGTGDQTIGAGEDSHFSLSLHNMETPFLPGALSSLAHARILSLKLFISFFGTACFTIPFGRKNMEDLRKHACLTTCQTENTCMQQRRHAGRKEGGATTTDSSGPPASSGGRDSFFPRHGMAWHSLFVHVCGWFIFLVTVCFPGENTAACMLCFLF